MFGRTLSYKNMTPSSVRIGEGTLDFKIFATYRAQIIRDKILYTEKYRAQIIRPRTVVMSSLNTHISSVPIEARHFGDDMMPILPIATPSVSLFALNPTVQCTRDTHCKVRLTNNSLAIFRD